MAVRIYSDVTKKFYDDEAAALKAEKELETKRTEAAECRKKMAHKKLAFHVIERNFPKTHFNVRL
jgi:hypothetical protein